MKRWFIAMLALPALWLAGSCGNNASNDSVEKADSMNNSNISQPPAANAPVDEKTSDFMVNAANGGMTEVELGKLAQDKSSNQRVKEFGQMMVQDHTQANDKLKSLADMHQVTLPSTIGNDKQDDVQKLEKKSGKEFDKDYMDMMVKDHEKTIKAFEDAASNMGESDIRTFIENTLPTLRKHLDSAKAIQESIK